MIIHLTPKTGARHTLSDGSFEYDLKGEVGVLTRNIVIEGEVVASEKDFGGSVRVAELTAEGEVYRGVCFPLFCVCVEGLKHGKL